MDEKEAQAIPGKIIGGLAQLARAPALHAGGQRFDSVILHHAVIAILLHEFFDLLEIRYTTKRVI